MTEFLNHGYYKEELLKEKALAKLGPELTAELFVNSSWRDHPPGSEGKSLEDERRRERSHLTRKNPSAGGKA